MTKNGDLLAPLILFLVGWIAILANGPIAMITLLMLLPIVAVGAIVAVSYMGYVYRRMAPPRPVFFRMLMGSQIAKIIMGVIVGYLSVATLGSLTGLFTLWTPTREERSAFVALIVCILLSPPMYYAYVIWRGRHRAGRSEFDEGDRNAGEAP